MASRKTQFTLPGLEPDNACASDSLSAEQPVVACVESQPQRAEAEREQLAGSERLAGRSVWLIDANSLIFQVFHAIPEMTSNRGEPVNAVFGFTRDVLFLLETHQPDYLFCAFDLEGKTFRHDLSDQYKAHRSEMPSALGPQFPAIRNVLTALGIPILECPSYEADDLLATVARMTEDAGGECFLVTGDKDCRQLISSRVKVYNVRKQQMYDAQSLLEDWGIRPDQVADYQALVGDSVDNIPGVPLIGPKFARELLEKYDTLESILDHAGEVAGAKRRENLLAARSQALLSRELARLHTAAPILIDWENAGTGRYNISATIELFKQFGFHSLADRVRALDPVAATANWQADYHVVDTPEGLAELVAQLNAQPLISMGIETTDASPMAAEIVGLSFAWQEGDAHYIPVCGPAGDKCLHLADTLRALRPVFENPNIQKVGQNLKRDLIVLRDRGIELAGLHFDGMVASYLLDAGERNHDLHELAQRYLDHKNIKIGDLLGSGKDQKRSDQLAVAQFGPYAAENADVALRLYPLLADKLAETRLEELFRTVELPLIEVLAELEFNGIKVDRERLAELSGQYGIQVAELERQIYELAGREFNIGSPKQLQQVLFQEQKLPVLKRTKTGPSTDADVLEELAAEHPLPSKIIEYRQFAKLKNTYVDALPAMINPRTGRVHASFHQAVAATGRLSSSDPNLQNIPIRTQSGREIRSAFLPGEPDWLLLAADYSQIELRILAHFSHDQTLRDAFSQDEDIHQLVASQVYGVPLGEVTRDMRRNAKAVNFGVIYGQSPFGLAKQLRIEQSQAAEFIEAYFRRYPGVDEFLLKILAECRQKGYVGTILGRRRAIQGVRPVKALGADATRQRSLPERTAINTVIQGSAADLIKLAMIRVYQRLRREGLAAKLLLQIHDELIFEAPSDELTHLADLVTNEMSSVLALDVPLKVDVKSGKNWADVEPWA